MYHINYTAVGFHEVSVLSEALSTLPKIQDGVCWENSFKPLTYFAKSLILDVWQVRNRPLYYVVWWPRSVIAKFRNKNKNENEKAKTKRK